MGLHIYVQSYLLFRLSTNFDSVFLTKLHFLTSKYTDRLYLPQTNVEVDEKPSQV